MRLVALCLGLALLAIPASAQNLDAPGALGNVVTITLTNGETFTGTLIERTGLDVTLDHPLLGVLTIPRTTIAVQPEEPEEDAALDDTHDTWTGTADLSLAGSLGNTESRSTHAEINMRRENDDTVDTIKVTADNQRQTDQATVVRSTTQNEQYFKYRREWKLDDSSWRPFFQVEDQRDSNKEYHDLVTVSGGGTYVFYEETDEALYGRVGLAETRRFGDPTNDKWQTEGVLGGEYRLDISKRNHVAADVTVYPSLSDVGEFRSVSSAEWRLDLSDASPWYYKVGARHLYDSTDVVGQKKGDIDYYAGVGTVF